MIIYSGNFWFGAENSFVILWQCGQSCDSQMASESSGDLRQVASESSGGQQLVASD